MRILALILFLFAAGAHAATNVQHIQVLTGGTNNGKLSVSVLTAGARGPGTYDLQSGDGHPDFIYWKVGTNVTYQFPTWMQLGGTNYQMASTNWFYYNLGSNSVTGATNDWEQFRFTVGGATPGGFQNPDSNAWVSFFLLFENVASSSLGAPNIDMIYSEGLFGGYCVPQLQLRTNQMQIFAHSQGSTNGFAIPVTNGVVYFVTLTRESLSKKCECQIYNATNNFQPLLNESGYAGAPLPYSIGSVSAVDPSSTNSSAFRIQANYKNYGASIEYCGSGRIWMGGLTFGWGNAATPPVPSTNLLHPDRYFTLTPNVNAGYRGTRPNRTSETIISGDPDSIGSALSSNWTAAASNTVIVLNGTNVIRTTVVLRGRDGVTIRGTNNSTLILAGSGSLHIGPTALSIGQAAFFYPTNTSLIRMGATNINLITNYSTRGTPNNTITPGQMYFLSEKYDFNPNNPNFNMLDTSDGVRSSGQLILIEGTNGNAISFSPACYQDYTNQPCLIMIYDTASNTRPIRKVGFENITLTTSNGLISGATVDANVVFSGLVDSWVERSQAENFNNNGFHFQNSIFTDWGGSNIVHRSFNSPSATGNGGVLFEGVYACYFYNSIFYDTRVAFQSFDSDSGNVFSGIHMANNVDGRSWLMHKVGAQRNVFEHCTTEGTNGGSWVGDSYFGPAHRNTFYRDRLESLIWNRWGSYNNALANSLGSTNFDLRYDMDAVGNTYEIFTLGFPNISNLNTNGINKDGVSGSVGRFWPGVNVGTSTSNYYKFTNVALQVLNGTNIQGDFSTWPSSSSGYSVIFQDGTDTNRYWRLGDFQTDPYDQRLYSLGYNVKSASNLQLLMLQGSTPVTTTLPITISNGWTMYLAGPTAYQQRQTADVRTHIRSFNHVLTNLTEAVVYDPTFLPRGYSPSLVYSSMPSWWVDTNNASLRWPAIDPANSTEVTDTPAWNRYRMIDQSASGGTPPASGPGNSGHKLKGGGIRVKR